MITKMIAENERRKAEQKFTNPYAAFVNDSIIDKERCKTDFQYWAAVAVKIRDKKTGRVVPFLLNRAQLRVFRKLEAMREQGKPMRLIMLKARQWGGSTLIEVMMAWIQLVHHTNWHSVICAHVKDSARNIRAMYTGILSNYPPQIVESCDGKPYTFKGFERAQNVLVISGRDCRVFLASAESQDSIRGADIAMAHLSEVAYWKETPQHDPEDFMRAVCSSVPLEPDTLVVIESTANGVGNFFHNEWLRAEAGKSDKTAVFVPWYEIDMYSLPVSDPAALIENFTDYDRMLWEKCGCTLEQINWYRNKLAEYSKPELMHAEFPTTPNEAFVSADANVFNNEHIERLRTGCRTPLSGEIQDGTFHEDRRGLLKLWEHPRSSKNYVVVVDVGGRSAKSDWSVIAVFKKGCSPSEKHEVVAQWRGHIDHDLLGDKAMTIAHFYNNALLVIESNTLESAHDETLSATVLVHVAREYNNTYRRRTAGTDGGIGFHTNRNTKSRAIDTLVAALREQTYIERDKEACNEMATYCRLANGSYQARRGCHDDILMTRAIGLYVIAQVHPPFNPEEWTWNNIPQW